MRISFSLNKTVYEVKNYYYKNMYIQTSMYIIERIDERVCI